MFTGLVRERGTLTASPQPSGKGGVRLVIGHSTQLGRGLAIGDSLAVNGVCLTLVEKTDVSSTVELAPETLRRTRLGELGRDDAVNLEPALRAGDPLGGHIVQGHVDTTISVVGREDLADHREVAFDLEASIAPYVVEKGSVTLDGVSLTVASLSPDRFTVALIPHTLEVTTLGDLEVGDRVHIEVDILAKYVARAVAAWDPAGRDR